MLLSACSFALSPPSSLKYAVVFEKRANESLDRQKVIEAVAGAVPKPHRVDLSNPEKTILVQIVKVSGMKRNFAVNSMEEASNSSAMAPILNLMNLSAGHANSFCDAFHCMFSLTIFRCSLVSLSDRCVSWGS